MERWTEVEEDLSNQGRAVSVCMYVCSGMDIPSVPFPTVQRYRTMRWPGKSRMSMTEETFFARYEGGQQEPSQEPVVSEGSELPQDLAQALGMRYMGRGGNESRRYRHVDPW